MRAYIRRVALLHLALIIPVFAGGQDSSDWNPWSTTPAPAPAKETVQGQGWTDWVTIVDTVTSTVYVPTVTTVYKDVPTTVISTSYVTTISVSVSVSQPPASTVTLTETETQVSISGSVQTLVDTVVNTATVLNTATVNQQITVTGLITNVVTQTVTSTVSTCPVSTTEVLTTLVPCPTRITNPDYSGPPASELPNDYTWGCPPGLVCKPVQINCNFESNPPADSYLCNPSQCVKPPELPPLDFFLGFENQTEFDCAFFPVFENYFNLNPSYFDLGFNIFQTLGQAECTTAAPAPPPPPPITSTSWSVWVAPPAPTTLSPPPPTTQWQSWTTSVAPAPVVSSWNAWSQPQVSTPAKESWAGWSQPPKPSPESSWDGWSAASQPPAAWSAPAAQSASVPAPASSWGGWSGQDSNHHTKRAVELIPRQDQNALVFPQKCYGIADACALVFQKLGKSSQLCDQSGAFQQGLDNLNQCADSGNTGSGGSLTSLPGINIAVEYCNIAGSSSTASPQAESTTGASSSSVPPSTSATPTSSAGSSPSASSPTQAPATSPSSIGSSTPPGSSSASGSPSTGGSTGTATASTGATGSASSSASTPVATFTGSASSTRPELNTLCSLFISILAFIVRI